MASFSRLWQPDKRQPERRNKGVLMAFSPVIGIIMIGIGLILSLLLIRGCEE